MQPRINVASYERLDELNLELFGEENIPRDPVLNVTRLWAVHPALMKAQRDLQTHVLRHSTLDPRIRELAILRVGWRCDSGYELAQHAVFALRAGLTEAELERMTKGADELDWEPLEAAVLRAVDEMIDDAFVSDGTWTELGLFLSNEQILDLLVVVGRYWTVSVVVNSTGLQLEQGTEPFSAFLTGR